MPRLIFRFTALMVGFAWASMAQEEGGSRLTLSPTSLTFNATAGGAAPPSQTLSVRASSRTAFTASVSVRMRQRRLASHLTFRLSEHEPEPHRLGESHRACRGHL